MENIAKYLFEKSRIKAIDVTDCMSFYGEMKRTSAVPTMKTHRACFKEAGFCKILSYVPDCIIFPFLFPLFFIPNILVLNGNQLYIPINVLYKPQYHTFVILNKVSSATSNLDTCCMYLSS